jgi:hypothetical protein
MKRLVGLAIAMLAVPAIGASAATTVLARGATPAAPSVAGAGAWVITTPHEGCENVTLTAHHKFSATDDGTGNAGTWNEQTPTTIIMKWTSGDIDATVFKGTLASKSNNYNGRIRFENIVAVDATLIPGHRSGC